MTQVGTVYGEALYELALSEGLDESIGKELSVLEQAFRENPDYGKLLRSANLSKAERCGILDEAFHDRVHPYLLNFLKILVEKGYIGSFDQCCGAYTRRYNEAHGILPVTAVTAVPLTDRQAAALTEKLSRITGKTISLRSRVDPDVLGGVRLDYDGKRLDDTVAHRLESIHSLLKKDVL